MKHLDMIITSSTPKKDTTAAFFEKDLTAAYITSITSALRYNINTDSMGGLVLSCPPCRMLGGT